MWANAPSTPARASQKGHENLLTIRVVPFFHYINRVYYPALAYDHDDDVSIVII